ncbi:hypothetical protein [Lacunisphaera limnophila]|uniref:hypothetical protein n=1 Tax=Lacunisphaera limnophila TaxID=1838286 RepID=UPI0008599EDE|nr:hypothetical protein [Lacunisphaera limnophila]
MNAPVRIPSRGLNVRFLVALCPLISVTLLASDPVGAPASGETAKTQVLFMGADISVELDRSLHPLREATDHALIVDREGRSVEIPHRRVTDIRIKDVLKLSAARVAIDGLKAERAYAEGSDPFAGMARNVTLAAGESAVADIAQGERMRADQSVAGAGAAVAAAGNPEDRAAAGQMLAQAQGRLAAAEQAVTQAVQGAGYSSSLLERSQGAVGEERFDAIRLGFEIRAERDLERPYYALIALIRDPGSRTGDTRKWTYVKPLGPMAAGSTRKVRALQGGLPPGYVLESWDVHVYDRGEEVATNLSRKRVEVTEAEAQEFRIFEYIANHRGHTLPASPMDPVLVEAAWATLPAEQGRRTWHVRVDRNGWVTAVFADAAGKQPASDAGLVAVLKTLRFAPALAAGKPVESLLPLQLEPPR